MPQDPVEENAECNSHSPADQLLLSLLVMPPRPIRNKVAPEVPVNRVDLSMLVMPRRPVAVRNNIQADASQLSKLIMPKRPTPVKSTAVAPADENGDDALAPEAVEFSK